MKLSIETGSEFQKVVAEIGSMGKAIVEATSAGLAKGVKFAAGTVVSEHLKGQDLQTRTGHMSEAVDGWMDAPLDGVIGVREGAAVDRYKWLLGTEQKTIVPKSSKFLAIPIGEGLTSTGVARYASPRNVEGAFILKSKTGGLFIAKKFGKTNRSIKPLFILKKSVVVTGSGALIAGVLDSVDGITKEISSEIDRRTN